MSTIKADVNEDEFHNNTHDPGFEGQDIRSAEEKTQDYVDISEEFYEIIEKQKKQKKKSKNQERPLADMTEEQLLAELHPASISSGPETELISKEDAQQLMEKGDANSEFGNRSFHEIVSGVSRHANGPTNLGVAINEKYDNLEWSQAREIASSYTEQAEEVREKGALHLAIRNNQKEEFDELTQRIAEGSLYDGTMDKSDWKEGFIKAAEEVERDKTPPNYNYYLEQMANIGTDSLLEEAYVDYAILGNHEGHTKRKSERIGKGKSAFEKKNEFREDYKEVAQNQYAHQALQDLIRERLGQRELDILHDQIDEAVIKKQENKEKTKA